MNFQELYNQLGSDFNLKDLEVSKTIQKQFLLDVYDLLGEKQFDALQASATMGEEFYATTLKHLVPNYEEIFQASRQKVVVAFKG